MNSNMIILILGSTVAYFGVMLAFYFYIKAKKREHAKLAGEFKSQIEFVRSAFENELYQINAKLEKTENRWRDINHLLLSPTNQLNDDFTEVKPVLMNDFLIRHNMTSKDLEVDNKLVFLLTPFHKKHSDVYQTISYVCKKQNLVCLRGDETFVEGDILNFIIKNIVKSRLVIAYVTGRNPNVFYELGIAHALNKDVVIVSSRENALPFDLRSKRVILYQNHNELSEELNSILKKIKPTEEFSILKAWYGIETSNFDVTEKVKGLIKNGQLDFPVLNTSLGIDPLPGVPKTLFVKYRQGGEEKVEIVPEGKHILIK